MSRTFWPLAAVSCLALSLAGCAGQSLPADARSVLHKADEITLYSLNPDVRAQKEGQGLQGWEVLGQVKLTGDDKRKVLAALERGIAASDGRVAACFNPRHGVEATYQGKTVQLVICFECLSIAGYTDGVRFGVLTTREPQPTLDEVLKANGVKLPGQRGE